ncbi:hypothetical protein FRC20_010508 [Serendipita sp. 405]|nr:hypothetical protein FRC20_010508 [Serendipita sp. 405]
MAHNDHKHHEKLASLPTLDTNFEKRPLSTSSDESSSSSIVETPVKQPEPVVHKSHRHHRSSDRGDRDGNEKPRKHHHHRHHHKKHRSKRVQDAGYEGLQSPISEKSPMKSDTLSNHSSAVLDLEDPQNQPNLYEDPTHGGGGGGNGGGNGGGGGGGFEVGGILGMGPAPRRSFIRRHAFLIITIIIGLAVVGILAGVVIVKFAVLPNQHGHQLMGGAGSNWNPGTQGPDIMMGTVTTHLSSSQTTTPTPTS